MLPEVNVQTKKRQKVTIIGKGTAGLNAAMMCRKWGADDVDVEVVYNPKVKEASVGEGTQLGLPSLLYLCEGISPREWPGYFQGTVKAGIEYMGWGQRDYFHTFVPPSFGMHFSAPVYQASIEDILRNRHQINFVEMDVKSHDDLDSDYIIDASGAPKDIDNNPDYERLKFITVNSAMVAQIPWEYPKFQYTLAHAERFGWIFGIPLQERLSLGYMYNTDYNSKKEIKEDFNNYLDSHGHEHDGKFNHINFNSYKRVENWPDDRTAYVGNASFFLEPLEATAIQFQTDIIERTIYLWATNKWSREECNAWYSQWAEEAEAIIMCHYAAKNRWNSSEDHINTKFWQDAQGRGEECLSSCKRWLAWVRQTDGFELGHMNPDDMAFQENTFGGGWNFLSFNQNVKGLDLYENYT